MRRELVFAATAPETAATRLDAGGIHLWRIPYALSQGRAPLLALLAAYLDTPTTELVLAENPHGKPRLAASVSDRELEFNWSHSGDYALVALARDCQLGVDIERLGKNLRAFEIAQRFFDPAEAEALARLESQALDAAFIALWCAKEAILKESGEGLSFGLARLAFRQGAGDAWSLTRVDPALGVRGDWHLEGFAPAPGYRGALAWRGGPREVVALRPPERAAG